MNNNARHKRPLLVLFCLFTPLSQPLHADSAAAKLTWDMSIEHTRQTFDDTDGSYTTLTLVPGVEWGDGWQLRLDVPWQKTQGEAVVPRANPQLIRVCEWAALHPRRVQLWLAQGRITQAQLDRCNEVDGGVTATEAEGLADIIVWLNRFIPLGEHWAILPQVGYKTDSGDVDAGLGSGTRDALFEAGVYADFAPVSLYALVGHERVLRQSSLGDLDDFSYATLEFEYAFTSQWSAGAGLHHETSQVAYLDDMQSVSAQLSWRFLKNYSVLKNYSAQLSAQKYNEESGYPAREVGLSVSASF